MKAPYLFLLVYLQGSLFAEGSSARSNAVCTKETCVQVPDATSNFLQCAGLSPTDTGADHVRRLKGILEATMDVYTFMKSSMTSGTILSVEGALELDLTADPLQNKDLVRMWMEVKMKPLLKTITKRFLSCLSTKNFSCSTYQAVVEELSNYYSEMEPVRQKWIYTFFMYPFLSSERVAGCVKPNESSEEWLMKNFGAFSVMARLKDFSALNMVFSELEALDLLSPSQKAELLMSPEFGSLDNGTLALVFHSLLTGGPSPTAEPGWDSNWTTPGYPPSYPLQPSYNPQPGLQQAVNGFMAAFKPIGSFVQGFVSFTRERNVSNIKSTTMTQFLLNWTLAELADMYRQPNASVAPEEPQFDVTNVGDWYEHVVKPLLQRFLPNEELLMHQNIMLAFHEVFRLDHGIDNETLAEIQDVCSITLDKSPCGLTDAVANVAQVLHCSARNNLTLTNEVVMELVLQLTQVLNSLMREFSTTGFTQVVSEIQHIFSESESPSLTQEHLSDPEFIKLWFKVKLLPLLPNVQPELLSCLSTKNFSCPVYQTLVAALSKDVSFRDANLMHSHNIYKYFIYPFLLNHNTSDPQCVSSANHSAEWLMVNFGFFSSFAPITDFYALNPYFSGLEALQLLTPRQTAELLLLPLRTPPEKDVVINQVFDFLTQSPAIRKYPEVLPSLVELAKQESPPCNVYKQIFERLYEAIQSLAPEMEIVTWATIEELMNIAPDECIPANLTCPVTQLNDSHVCSGVDSFDLLSSWGSSKQVSCSFTLEKYACTKLDGFTANDLVSLLMCDLRTNSAHSKMLWKKLLTKDSSVLNPALDILAGMHMPVVPSASEVLDVIEEIRLLLLTNGQLQNSSVIRLWFSERLRSLLPFASGIFLRCLSSRDLTCQSYQQILQVFSDQFENMTIKQQHMVLQDFTLRFLTQPRSNSSCVSTANSTAQWQKENLGPFSAFLSLTELLQLNPQYNPMEVLTLLSPKQSAELLVLRLPSLPDKDVIINQLFDYLTESPDERKFIEFLTNLTVIIHPENFTCSSYKTLFTRLDSAIPVVSLEVAIVISHTKLALSQQLPPDCTIYGGQCNTVMANITEICGGVNSSAIQLYLASGQTSGPLCNFTVEEIACASLSALTADQLATILKCNRSSNSSGSRPAWKLLLTKASQVLDQALDQLANMTLDPRSPAVSKILDTIQELRIDTLNVTTTNDPAFIQMWFGHRLLPFLPAVSPDFLSCLTTRNLTCSSYQEILQKLSYVQPQMTLARQMSVYTNFIKVFLTRNNSSDPACSSGIPTSVKWIQINLGGFSKLASIDDILKIYPKFSVTEALSQLSVRQLAEVVLTPGQITTSEQVYTVMSYVPDHLLPAFFDDFSPAIGQVNDFPLVVRSTMLQVVFNRANLSDHSVDDSEVQIWLQHRLPPLLVQLSPDHVRPYFSILAGRSCNIEHVGVKNLNMTITTLSKETQEEIYNRIIQTLRGPTPLRCYGDSYSRSFYEFLESTFMGFNFPNLTTFLSLVPLDRLQPLISSMPPSDLGNFLRRPHVVDNDAELCVLYSNYRQTPQFLQTEPLPEVVRRPTLPCVWPMALSSTQRSDVNAWFDLRLKNYLAFLTKDLISPSITYNASCLAFQKFVSVLGVYNYNNADFMRSDVFSTISTYLYIDRDANPRCYIASDPELNSTAWFAEYIGPFTSFLTLDDLLTFGSQTVIQVFTVNPLNIALFNHSVLPDNLTTYYTELIYEQDSNFNPILLPLRFRCFAPGPAYTQLSAEDSIIVLRNLTILCTDLDPQISAALAGNFGDRIDADVIAALGKESSGMSINQIESIKPEDLRAALDILASVTDWDEGQARAIIQSLLSSGMIRFNSSSLLISLGSLIMGVPVKDFKEINTNLLLDAFQNPSLVQNLLSGPEIIQEIVVTQIISVDSNNEKVIENVPDDLGTEIPRPVLVDFSSSNLVVTNLNKKKWIQQQAELFFNVITVESATAQLGGPDNLSSSVLQGFTCTGVRAISIEQIKKLIRACRRTGSNKVTLMETQLTCMYNYIKADDKVSAFDLYPPDVLLYYDYSLVPQNSCRSYFTELGGADFSVFSPALSYKQTALFENAKSCLGITNTNLTADKISVLGNMCCILEGSYIENSDPSILEKLKGCSDLTGAQAAAVQSLLIKGKTKYGAPSTWTVQTLKDLGMLPLYLTSVFYDNFALKTKRTFLRYFLGVLGKKKVSREKKKKLKSEMRISVRNKSKQSPATECTVGFITRVTISDEAFPLDYSDINQFHMCLNATVVRDNLDAITQKVDQDEYLKIVLSKLREAYNASSTIPENQVQVLSLASRVATMVDINMWTLTEIDTLAALMDPINGVWNPSLARAIITKYLSINGSSLGTAELNVIGGPNLCSLDVGVLRNIPPKSLQMAKALDMSNCTIDQKTQLFTIAFQSFTQRTRSSAVPVSTYQLIKAYLPGTNIAFVRSLVSSNVSMDLATFAALPNSVIMNLTVADVQGLLGANLADLKSYENVTEVQTWIRSQFQSDLNKLGVGVTGGIADSTTSTTAADSSSTTATGTTGTTATGSTGPAVTTSSTSPNQAASTSTVSTSGTSSTTTSSTTISTTKPSGSSSSTLRGTGFSFLVLLVLLITSQHVLM